MRLVLIHGRGQGQRTQAEVEQEWREGLDAGFWNARLTTPVDMDIRLPFYGARLDEFTARTSARLGNVVERGASGADAVIDQFEVDLIAEIASRAGVSERDARAELDTAVVQRGVQHWEWTHALGRALSRRVPWIAEFGIARFAADVHVYLTNRAVRKQLHELVGAELPAGPCVVVAHSLGSLLGYWLLTERAKSVDVRLLVTVGSPLGVRTVKEKLPTPLGKPGGVRRWVNAADERDPIALHARLDRDTFPADIENASDVHNPKDNAHGIRGYLSDGYVIRRLYEALTSA